MIGRVSLHRWDELPLEKITEMVSRKVIRSAQAQLTQAYYKKGAVVPLHAHRTDVMVYILQGALRTSVEGVDVTAREGEVVVVAAGASHQAECLDDTFVLTFMGFEEPLRPAS